MHIREVRTARKFGDFVLKQNHRNKIDLKYLPEIPRQALSNEVPRIYLFVVIMLMFTDVRDIMQAYTS